MAWCILGFLYDLSDDINEIKEKLGLEVTTRTPIQRQHWRIKYVHEEAMKGKSKEEIMGGMFLWDRIQCNSLVNQLIKERQKKNESKN